MQEERQLYEDAVKTLRSAMNGEPINPQKYSVSMEILRAVFLQIYNNKFVQGNNNDTWADTIEDK